MCARPGQHMPNTLPLGHFDLRCRCIGVAPPQYCGPSSITGLINAQNRIRITQMLADVAPLIGEHSIVPTCPEPADAATGPGWVTGRLASVNSSCPPDPTPTPTPTPGIATSRTRLAPAAAGTAAKNHAQGTGGCRRRGDGRDEHRTRRAHRNEEEVIAEAANLVTLARTSVECDFRGDVIDAHAPEMPTRFAKQLTQVVRGGAAIGMDRIDAVRLAVRCARDSMPPLRLAIIDDVANNPAAPHTRCGGGSTSRA